MSGWFGVTVAFLVMVLVTVIMASNHVHYCVSIPGTHTKSCQGYYKK